MQRVIGAVFAPPSVRAPSARASSVPCGGRRDASGAVLPGVTVEAASPVLLEKVRTAVSDGTGQYRITDLTPGTYTVTYTLPGFVTVKRDAVELSGNVVVTLNAELRVGGVQETVTVTGETPVVDVQTSTRRTTVLDDAVVSAIPASRGYGNLLATVVGISGDRSRRQLGRLHQLLHRARRPRQRRHDPDRRHERRARRSTAAAWPGSATRRRVRRRSR